MREWQVAVVEKGGGRQTIEEFAHWHMGSEHITVREVRKLTIEQIAEKFRREVLPHIGDLLENDNGNQFEGYVFSYIMAHEGWDWSNSRNVEFLEMFSSR
jgi:hypothetical protein